jgi:acetamidase/formamidase
LHTTDVSGTVTMDVEVIHDLELDGPILLPNEEDLPFISEPYDDAEREAGVALGADHGVDVETEMAPVQVIGSGATVNDATQNAFDRAGTLFDMSEGEVRARCTFTGGVQIGRLPGVVQLDMLVPKPLLAARGLDELVETQYGV